MKSGLRFNAHLFSHILKHVGLRTPRHEKLHNETPDIHNPFGFRFNNDTFINRIKT